MIRTRRPERPSKSANLRAWQIKLSLFVLPVATGPPWNDNSIISICMTWDPLVAVHLSSELLSGGCDCLQVTPWKFSPWWEIHQCLPMMPQSLPRSGPPIPNKWCEKDILTNYTVQESNIAIGQSPFLDDVSSCKPPFIVDFPMPCLKKTGENPTRGWPTQLISGPRCCECWAACAWTTHIYRSLLVSSWPTNNRRGKQ